jgi:hypothetical protein
MSSRSRAVIRSRSSATLGQRRYEAEGTASEDGLKSGFDSFTPVTVASLISYSAECIPNSCMITAEPPSDSCK